MKKVYDFLVATLGRNMQKTSVKEENWFKARFYVWKVTEETSTAKSTPVIFLSLCITPSFSNTNIFTAMKHQAEYNFLRDVVDLQLTKIAKCHSTI
jgi:hypothetical protein